ncbi:lantibiotic dehydratase [Plantactinospora sp. KBS50]|uniref:lantibiotic dehydratase n=1 Tax=Plantactinospora sp. KBS50 TaxID=2024580 RepID=UPI000BAADAA4|nr:lantibiotic dehydratase [Plantactinospora sp. KBS50]ASW54325.1 hypothetical protein CIK06_09160 [Plantactinospora sp. KBS50]
MPYHVPLGRSGWSLWRDAALRGTGFPARRILEICDDELAAAADACDEAVPATGERYSRAYLAAAARLSAAVRHLATDPRFREAVTWQNPALLGGCLDRLAAGEPRNVRGRGHELTVVSYLQRYCLKNDTIGFFGPVGWALVAGADPATAPDPASAPDPAKAPDPAAAPGSAVPGLSPAPGPALLRRRTTYFEGWALDVLAEVLGARPDVWPWLRPRRLPTTVLTGWLLRLPLRKPVKLSAAEVRVLPQCDGGRAVLDIAGDPPDPALVAALLRLCELGAIRIDLHGVDGTWPERDLARRIDTIADPQVRARTRAPLDELMAGRDAVAAAGGDPERLAAASATLAGAFERITEHGAARDPGRSYAARTLVYEDTVRDVDVRIGQRITERLAGPLGAVLDSVVWLANTVGCGFEARARALLDRSGGELPLANLLNRVLPDLRQLSRRSVECDLVDEATAGLQTRWRRVLGLTRRCSTGRGTTSTAPPSPRASPSSSPPGRRAGRAPDGTPRT